jgi:WS/DGAT/MGAT family acyltransferase
MQQLSGLDASFLFLESPEMPMHVGSLNLYELPASYRGNYLDDVRRHVAARLVIAPALRRKLALMPLNLAAPAWVDAEPDLDEHIVGITLPDGSGQAELEAQVGHLHPQLLDRSRPLWKFFVFDGLAPGDDGQCRVAVYTQLHHAAVDGQAAVALAQALLDLGPEPRQVPQVAAPKRRGQLGMTEMLRGALAHQLTQVTQLVKAVPSVLGAVSQVAAQTAGGALGGGVEALLARLRGHRAAGATRVSNLGLAPRTRLNAMVSAERAFAGVSLPLAELNAVRRRHDISLNDAVMMVCSGALRRHFAKHGPLPRKSLVAAVPISLRVKGDAKSNNQASLTVVSLGTHLADPAKRLAHLKAASAAMKSTLSGVKSVLPTDFPSMGVPWIIEGLMALYGRASGATRLPPFANVTISNVPGPTVPLYLAGARLISNYPTSIVVHGVALNITVQTYHESLDVGIMSCAKAMPEVAEFAAQIETAFEEFKALAPALPAVKAGAAAGGKPAAKKTPVKKTATRKPTARKSPAAKKATAPTPITAKKAAKEPAVKPTTARKPTRRARVAPAPRSRARAPIARRTGR